MYNRYVPQPDGSFRRTRLPDRSRPVPQKQEHHPESPEVSCVPESVFSPPPPCAAPQETAPCTPTYPPPKLPQKNAGGPGKHNHYKKKPEMPPCGPNHGSIGGFFRQLLPKDMDTGDLLIILLLLLMAGDCRDEQNTALLTLILYLFM